MYNIEYGDIFFLLLQIHTNPEKKNWQSIREAAVAAAEKKALWK
jgi:hypothetical protein